MRRRRFCHHRTSFRAYLSCNNRQLGDIRRDPPRLIARQQFRRQVAELQRPTVP
jgi:hypothetical protein